MIQWLKSKVKLKLRWPSSSQWENQNPNLPKHVAISMVPPSPWIHASFSSICHMITLYRNLFYIRESKMRIEVQQKNRKARQTSRIYQKLQPL